MYVIKHHIKKNTLEISNTALGVYGKIHLNDGGSLQELTLNHTQLIADLNPLSYKTTYASAILFPFANRIEDGKYCFKNEVFQLETNNKEEHNALHGLVYDKAFEVIVQSTQKNNATIVLQFKYNGTIEGFPFPYTIQLTYVFENDYVDLKVNVKNDGLRSFPFTLGWHPYFLSENLSESQLNFESTNKLNIGDRNIAKNLKIISKTRFLNFKKDDFDDCWLLDKNGVTLSTPKYQLVMNTSEPNGFLQIYTPPKANVVAIEPTTGISNSFNNKIGLKTLEPNKVFEIIWSLKIQEH